MRYNFQNLTIERQRIVAQRLTIILSPPHSYNIQEWRKTRSFVEITWWPTFNFRPVFNQNNSNKCVSQSSQWPMPSTCHTFESQVKRWQLSRYNDGCQLGRLNELILTDMLPCIGDTDGPCFRIFISSISKWRFWRSLSLLIAIGLQPTRL